MPETYWIPILPIVIHLYAAANKRKTALIVTAGFLFVLLAGSAANMYEDIISPPLDFPTSVKKRGPAWTPTMEGPDMKSQIPPSSFEDKNAIPKEVFDIICPDGIKDYFYIGSCILDSSNTGWIDLNNDGVKEILISGYNLSAYRGSGGWRSGLFQKKGGTYTPIQTFFGWEIYVLKSKTNGYFDLLQNYKRYIKGGGWEPAQRLFNWKKDKYVETIMVPRVKLLSVLLFASSLIGFVIVLRKFRRKNRQTFKVD